MDNSSLENLGPKTARSHLLVSVVVPGGLLVQEPDVGRPEEDIEEPDQDGGVGLGEACVDGGVAVTNSRDVIFALVIFIAGRSIISEDVRLKCLIYFDCKTLN